jgi:hypothetical protein
MYLATFLSIPELGGTDLVCLPPLFLSFLVKLLNLHMALNLEKTSTISTVHVISY